ncbi:AmmeMemoRadiSam system protein A [Candidatus Parcubacteria bacterium]|nr:MAG: AmmeMemoRadiSam system protein A [Candidatus Parcubacteria bacterium]
MALSDNEKKELLNIARKTVELYLKGKKVLDLKTDNPKFLEKKGVFVTLHQGNDLRGCIGNILPIYSLIEGVRNNALAAAFDDPRFLPLAEKELPRIKIEISVLSVPRQTTINEITPFRDGIALEKGNLAATFLPQVWQDLPDKSVFLSNLCLKAGLPQDSWQRAGTNFQSYRAEVFSE